ncbi:MAG: hypothetical protein KJ990_13125 [Proteobacteria bacterium]|nr:hypothetical protein [Pseudomonadota bacterium]MBU1649795.1 hypothetical protein [Pseudomonadota bacterium]
MTNPVSTQAHIDPKLLRQHNNKNLQALESNTPATGKMSLDKTSVASDTVTISQRSETAVTYSKALTMEQNVAGDGFDLLRGLVLNMLKEQGIDFKVATGATTGVQEIDISQLSQEEAQALIADDGYFGVKQTSDRIVNFAISMAGGDPSRLATIKEGVDKGFNEALKAFGGQLPDISYDTYDAVMKKLDDWAGNTTADQQS